jgi:hypothetical protein
MTIRNFRAKVIYAVYRDFTKEIEEKMSVIAKYGRVLGGETDKNETTIGWEIIPQIF